MRFLILLLRLDLLAICDSANNPRTGVRRGELWSKLAFNISKSPFPLVCELERMSRGKTMGICYNWAKLIMRVSSLDYFYLWNDLDFIDFYV